MTDDKPKRKPWGGAVLAGLADLPLRSAPQARGENKIVTILRRAEEERRRKAAEAALTISTSLSLNNRSQK